MLIQFERTNAERKKEVRLVVLLIGQCTKCDEVGYITTSAEYERVQYTNLPG